MDRGVPRDILSGQRITGMRGVSPRALGDGALFLREKTIALSKQLSTQDLEFLADFYPVFTIEGALFIAEEALGRVLQVQVHAENAASLARNAGRFLAPDAGQIESDLLSRSCKAAWELLRKDPRSTLILGDSLRITSPSATKEVLEFNVAVARLNFPLNQTQIVFSFDQNLPQPIAKATLCELVSGQSAAELEGAYCSAIQNNERMAFLSLPSWVQRGAGQGDAPEDARRDSA